MLNFKEATKSINERNQKTLFLFLQLPWLFSVVASISATSQGLVYIAVPKSVNDSFIGFVFRNISNQGIYIVAVALCNFLVDLVFFYILTLFKHKFEINKLKVVALLLLGHVLAIFLYFFSLRNENTDAIATSVMHLFFLACPFYIFVRYLPKKYLEILLPYSLIFAVLEIQTLRKTGNKLVDDHVFKNSRRRIGMYIKAMVLEHASVSSEVNLVGVLRKQEAINRTKGNENKKAIQDFYNYLDSSFGIRIPTSEIVFGKETSSEKLLRRIISSLDAIFGSLIFFVARNSTVLDLEEKAKLPVVQKKPRIPTSYDSRSFRQLIKYHLDRAKTMDALSAKQKLYTIIFSSFLSLMFPTILYIIHLEEDSSSGMSNYRSMLLFIQYLSTFVFALFTTNYIRRRYRDAGVDVTMPNRLVGSFTSSLQFLIFFMVVLSGDKSTYTIIIPVLLQNMDLLFWGIVAIQLVLLFMMFKPPVELKKSTFASSLLVRELLLLYSQILDTRTISNRRRIGRYIYFAKKYFNLIAKDLIYSRFDARPQKMRLREYFGAINDYLDNLGAQIRLGGGKNRLESIDQIETLILVAAIEEFGEIPDAIPEFQKHLEIKSVQPKQPSLIRQIIQILDTSPAVRTILILLLFLLINLLNSSLWVDLQNLSSLFQLLTP